MGKLLVEGKTSDRKVTNSIDYNIGNIKV